MWATKLILRAALHRSHHHRQSLVSIRNVGFRAEDPEAEWDRMYQRGVPRTMEEMSALLGETVDSPPDAKLLKVAVVGVPNSGKSTLINNLMAWRVCSVSSKVHTTRINARAALIHGSTQLVFLDTPGLVTPTEVSKHGLERSVLIEAEMSMQNADIMAVVHDMSNRYNYSELHPRVLRLLALYPTVPSVLILNKLDILKSKRHLLDATRLLTDGVVGGKNTQETVEKTHKLDREALIAKALRTEQQKTLTKQEEEEPKIKDVKTNATYDEEEVLDGRKRLSEHEVLEFIKERRGWPKFQDVFMVSALQGLGVDDFRDYLFSKAYKSPWIFNSRLVTDQNPEEIVLMAVREKFMETFRNEIPYKIKFDIDHWDLTDTDLLNIVVRAGCKRQGLARFVVGAGGFRISDIAREVEQELRNTFRSEVRLKINVVFDASLKKQYYKL